MPVHYPGWVIRLYFDLARDDPTLKRICDLACANNILDLCYVAKLPGAPMTDATKVFAMNWRFFPTLDPLVNFVFTQIFSNTLSVQILLNI